MYSPYLRYSPPGQVSCTHLQSGPQVTKVRYSPSAQSHVLSMPWVLTKARFQVSTSRSRVLTFRQGLRYLTPGQASGTHIQARPHVLPSRPGTYLQARRNCTHLQARPLVLTSLTRVLTSRSDVLTSGQKIRYSPPGQASCTNVQARRFTEGQLPCTHLQTPCTHLEAPCSHLQAHLLIFRQGLRYSPTGQT
jgi:hypothetical protein